MCVCVCVCVHARAERDSSAEITIAIHPGDTRESNVLAGGGSSLIRLTSLSLACSSCSRLLFGVLLGLLASCTCC